jgi:CO/xanthine dehydrogenase Mo-binding subunit
MLYGALAQSPVLGGKVSALDATVAEAMPGVRKVLVTAGGVVAVADHFWQALQARNALKITWDPGSNAGLDNAAIRALLEKAAQSDPGLSARKDGDAAAARGVRAAAAGSCNDGADELHGRCQSGWLRSFRGNPGSAARASGRRRRRRP